MYLRFSDYQPSGNKILNVLFAMRLVLIMSTTPIAH